jgi:hypothetical protein
MTVSQGDQWAVLGVLAAISVILIGLWLKYFPKYRRYRGKMEKLNKVNAQYEELRKRRKDLVFHYFWAVDSGSLREADDHEDRIINIDSKLNSLRESFKQIQSS